MASQSPSLPRIALPSWPAQIWALAIGLAVLLAPSFLSLAQQVWSQEAGVHGPIVLATGIWLFVREKEAIQAVREPGNDQLAWAGILASLAAYVFGRAFDFIVIEAGAVWGLLLSLFYLYFGWRAVRLMWFPIFYLAFLIPLPGWFIDAVTASLKEFVSFAATNLLQLAGYSIVRIGVTLFIDQYQLLVEDACSGLNSLVSLTSVSLFYIYLMHAASWRYALFLFAWILPVAIFANILRVIILVLLTYHAGNEAAQGFLHTTAGLVMFVIALLGIFLVDKIFAPLFHRLGWLK